jgi:hypothetical protein
LNRWASELTAGGEGPCVEQVQEQRDKVSKAQARGLASTARAEAERLKAMEAALGTKLKDFSRVGSPA